MENPRPRSPFTSSMICGSELHIARPVNGSKDRDFILFKLASVTVAVVVVDANEPSDLAFTKRSIVGNKFCRDPPRMLYKTRFTWLRSKYRYYALELHHYLLENVQFLTLVWNAAWCWAVSIGQRGSCEAMFLPQTMRTCMGNSFNTLTTSIWLMPSNRYPFTCWP